MKVENGRQVSRAIREMPREARVQIAKAIDKSLGEGARTARVLVPVDEGDLQASISHRMDLDGMGGEVTAGDQTRDGQIKALTVEGGRGADTAAGWMAAQPYISTARRVLAKRHARRIARAISSAAKKVAQRG